MNFSPLSAFHEYQLRWNRVYSKENKRIHGVESEKEIKALEALKHMEVMGSSQLFGLFIRDKKQIKQMEKRGLIKKHLLIRQKDEIPLYTLGYSGANVIDGVENLNRWFRLTEYMVLERILFFQLYQKLQDWYQDVQISPPPEGSPFVGTLIAQGGEKIFHALIVRKNEEKIRYYLSKTIPTTPIICIVEHPVYLKELNFYLKKCNIRVTTDEDLKQEDFLHTFSLWYQGQWVRESELAKNNQKTKEAVSK